MQILSAKVLPTIVFIIIPVIYMILSIIESMGVYQLRYVLRPIELELFYPFSIYSAPLPPLTLTIVILTFAFIPAIYSTPKFFKKKGFVNVIIEYEYLKIILYISIPILIALTISYFYDTQLVIEQGKQANKLLEQSIKSHSFEAYNEYSNSTHLAVAVLDPLRVLFFTIALVAVSIIIKLLLQQSRKEFRLYYAKGCFKIVSKEGTREVDKAEYFKTGLIWYNKFLKKKIGLYIYDIMKIYSKIITHSPLEQNRALISISESFDSEDGLKPLRYISAFIPDKDVGQALTKESIKTTIKESSDLLIPIIGVIITIITTFLLPKPPGH